MVVGAIGAFTKGIIIGVVGGRTGVCKIEYPELPVGAGSGVVDALFGDMRLGLATYGVPNVGIDNSAGDGLPTMLSAMPPIVLLAAPNVN